MVQVVYVCMLQYLSVRVVCLLITVLVCASVICLPVTLTVLSSLCMRVVTCVSACDNGKNLCQSANSAAATES